MKIQCITLFILLAACTTPGSNRPGVRHVMVNNPNYGSTYHQFILSADLAGRYQQIPGYLLQTLKKMDGRDNYTGYILTAKEKQLLDSYYKLLPPLTQKIMQQRLLGISFVNNFWGSGLTEWFVDKDNNFYAYMVLNASVLKKDISRLLSDKERTCFTEDNTMVRISVDCGNRYNGLLYILLHESTHVVDYAIHVTPYVEKGTRYLQKTIPAATPFTRGIWKQYDRSNGDFSFRKDVTFYGFGKGPKMSKNNAVAVYSELNRSPFVSLYASQNWAEDIAEYVTFVTLTEKLHVRYIIQVNERGRKSFIFEPFRQNRAMLQRRRKAIDPFYQ